MKNTRLALTLCLVITNIKPNYALALESEPLSFLKENPLITELNAEKDPEKKEAIYKKMEGSCPFKKEGSALGAIIPNAIALTLSPNLPESKKAECAAALKSFNDHVEKSKSLNGMVVNSSIKMTEEEKTSVQSTLTSAISASEGLSNMLQSQCEFQNSETDITMITNGIIKTIETGAAFAAYVNPMAGLVGAGTAAIGGLVVSMAQWLSSSNKNESTEEASYSEKFVNDMCTFRSLAMKYDKIYVDPFGNKKELAEWKPRVIGDDERIQEECVYKSKSNLDKLMLLSQELSSLSDKSVSQKQCLSLFSKYNKNKKNSENSFASLAEKYGCPTPSEDMPITYLAYCKNYNTIEAMNEGDIYEKCEMEDFQKAALAKFTSLSDILLTNITDEMKAIAPAYDKLQRVRDDERKQKLAYDQLQAWNASLDVNHITSLNTSRTMSDAGRNILGDNFDIFMKKSTKSADKDLKEAKKKIEDLVDRKTYLEEGGFFTSAEKNPIIKAQKQKEICRDAEVAKNKLADSYHAIAGAKDMCDFMQGDGIPPLKRPGFNFDIYSAGINDQDNNITRRCVKFVEAINTRFTEIEGQFTVMKTLGCGN